MQEERIDHIAKTWPSIDELDLRLIAELEVDARQSNASIAAKLGVSSSTVHNRLRKLLDAKVISIFAIASPEILGYTTRATIGIKIRPDSSQAVAEYLRASKPVRGAINTAGRYDILASAAFRNTDELIDYVNTELARNPDVVDLETMILLKVLKSSWQLSDTTDSYREATHYDVDQLDLLLIRELEQNPRATAVNLSQKLDTHRVLVSKRLQTLLDKGVIRIASVARESAFGFHAQTAILAKVHHSQINSAIDAATSNPCITQVALISGHFNVFLWARFHDAEHMYTCIKHEIGRLPGIMNYEVLPAGRLLKHGFSLLADFVSPNEPATVSNKTGRST